MNSLTMTSRLTSVLVRTAHQHGVKIILPNHLPSAGNELEEAGYLLKVQRDLAIAMQDEFYGMASPGCPPGTSELALETMVLSASLDEAIERSMRLYRLVTTGLTFNLTVEGECATVEMRANDPSLDPDSFLLEWYAIRWQNVCQWLIGEEFPLISLEFPHPPQTRLFEYFRIFGRNCRFSRPFTRLSFDKRYLGRRVIRTLADLEGIRDLLRQRRPPVVPTRSSWYHRSKTVLRTRLIQMDPIPTLEELAEEFGVCGQTLRRWFKAENTSYRQIKADVRLEIVLDSLQDPDVSLAEMSLMAGFAETNGLIRALKSWTGLSLTQFRRAAIAALSPEPSDVQPRTDSLRH